MAIPNEALQKLALEIESQAIAAQQQIGIVRTQLAAKQREQRLLRLTMSEVQSFPSDSVMYEGVGKMFVSLPPSTLQEKLQRQIQDLDGEVDKLNQRLLYLETTHKNSREHIDQILRTR
ncbi:Prefoldin [Trichoderma citrinoviride]|uniref:Prefoldin n=1 Tax=Trichoderma citrinoviride TaxID=58853 RepID=A0A2T4B481_9HYPO|nr:Prefoldin [Trichoderma citrinoviride]PTB64058.1 Prefoldin [Trichoderma citrinoviride]